MKSGLIKALSGRFISSLLILFILISFLFILLRLAPGDPAQKYFSQKLSPQLTEKIRESFGLNQSLPEQYYKFLSNISTGNLGISYSYHTPVIKVIAAFLPFTIVFSVISFVCQAGLGFCMAIYAFKHIGKISEKLITVVNYIIYSVPTYVSGVFLIFIFSEKAGLLPSSGIKDVTVMQTDMFHAAIDYIVHLILPVICLSLAGFPVYYKYFKDSISENFNKTYVKFLRTKGITENEILLKHVVPNSASPIIAYAGVDLGMLFSSVLITEVIFSLPGMGRLAVQAILDRDFPLVIGCTLFACILMLITNLLADFARLLIDKRLIKGILN